MTSTQHYRDQTVVRSFEEGDSTIPYRLVGTYEYQRVIDAFEKLVESSTEDEVKIYDKLISQRSEFALFSGADIGGAIPNNNSPVKDQKQFKAANKKNTLAWLLALARVEVGANISMYGEVNDPFGAVLRSQFGKDEYLQIMLDDAAAHIKALANDEGFQKSLSPLVEIESETLAYLRRVRLVRDLLNKVMSSNNPAVISVAEPFANQSAALVDQLIRKIDRQLGVSNERKNMGLTGRMQALKGSRPPPYEFDFHSRF